MMDCPDCSDDDGVWLCELSCPCECHDPAYDDDDDDECIGDRCCNPHPYHRLDECCTVEQFEAMVPLPEPEPSHSQAKQDAQGATIAVSPAPAPATGPDGLLARFWRWLPWTR